MAVGGAAVVRPWVRKTIGVSGHYRHALELVKSIGSTTAAILRGSGHSSVGRKLASRFAERRAPAHFHEVRPRPGTITIAGSAAAKPQPRFDPPRMRSVASACLGVDRIDRYQFHGRTQVPRRGFWPAWCKLIEEGKDPPRTGVSKKHKKPLTATLSSGCEAIRMWTRCQGRRFSPPEQSPAAEKTPSCVRAMIRGHLPTPHAVPSADIEFHEDAWRRWPDTLAGAARRSSKNPHPRLSRNLACGRAANPSAQRHETFCGVHRIAWHLSWRGLAEPLSSLSQPKQWTGWIGAGGNQAHSP